MQLNARTMTLSITEQVRDMYTRFPYPPPGALEGVPMPAIMNYARFVLWPERRDLGGLRVLDAGCGTGDTAVAIARANPDMEVVGIDLSTTSLEHARASADRQGVGSNLQLHCLPIQEVAALGMRFDYIISAGVIHHLDNPLVGLRALTDVLAPAGGMYLMLYATFGRAGVYQVQNALRMLAGDADFGERVELARALLQHLPANHDFNSRDWNDPKWPGDAGIVDLLLHVRDRSYTVPQIYELLDAAGLQLIRFADPLIYEPATYMSDAYLGEQFAALAPRARAELAELLCGRMCKHDFFATRKTYVPLHPVATGEVLLALRPRLSPLFAWNELQEVESEGQRLVRVRERALSERYGREFDLQPWHLAVLQQCDTERTTLELFLLNDVQAAIPADDIDAKLDLFGAALQELAGHEVIFCEP